MSRLLNFGAVDKEFAEEFLYGKMDDLELILVYEEFLMRYINSIKHFNKRYGCYSVNFRWIKHMNKNVVGCFLISIGWHFVPCLGFVECL